MKAGLIDCDFTLSKLPSLSDYRILLNHGMNIQYFLSDSGTVIHYDGFYGGKMRGEALEYVLATDKDDTLRPLPARFRVKYRGAFPLYTDTLNYFDFKGYIAFNGKTVRAAEQSKWYPVLYDVKEDRFIDQYSYNIRVTSDDAKSIFINGSVPQKGNDVTLTSGSARALFLFAGDYEFTSSNGSYILNADIDTAKAGAIFRELGTIKDFYAKKLGITYNENIFLISHKAVRYYRPQSSWGFTVFPSFAYANVDFSKLVDEKGRFNTGSLAFFSHELSHYYFGDNMRSGLLQWFWLESATEYLSLKAVEAMTNQTYYNQRVKDYASFVSTKDFKPLALVTEVNEISDDYRYRYGPLVFLAFEKQFGITATYSVLRDLIKAAEKETLTLDTWKRVALANNISEARFRSFYDKYLNGPEALKNVTAAAIASK